MFTFLSFHFLIFLLSCLAHRATINQKEKLERCGEILSLHLSPNDVDFHLLSIRHRPGRPMASFKSQIQSLLPVWPWTYQWTSVALIHCGGNGNPEVVDCQVYSNDPREVPGSHLFLYCSNLFTLLIEECCYGHFLEVWLAGILFSIQFTEKLLHIFSFSPWFLPFEPPLNLV